MTLLYILIFSLFALAAGMLVDRRWRNWLIFAGSLLAVYALQPATPIRHLDFWLPTLSLALCGLGWVVTAPKPGGKLEFSRTSLVSAVLMAGVVLSVGLTRYLDPLCCLIPTRPPELVQVLVGLGMVVLVAFILARLAPGARSARAGLALFIVLIAGLFVILKTDFLAQAASAWLRLLNGQPANLALASDLRWLGFSYIAFRLLQTLRDRQTGRLPGLSLQEYVSYVVFFPALTAGPIDRAERFVKDLNLSKNDAHLASWVEGGKRIAVGLFKKFVLADTLALVALSSVNFSQVKSTFWMWALLYAYALRIYFDFSGYTDIAIGIGRLLGIKLPENFDRPYLKPNLTSFWNSWHITLAQWFRTYIFNPLTRALRTARNPLPAYVVILIGQLTTMALIGLWHGVTWNFLLWGVWHGLGLFIHNRWLEFYRSRFGTLTLPAWLQQTLSILGTILTFNYVALGWVWFALPLPSQSWTVMLKLFGR
jgi:alginate O-acetyltransferase complex protein AlgI